MISHKQKETAPEALALVMELGRDECWLDVHMKDKSTEAMREGVVCSDNFLAIISEGYFESEYCWQEMEWAFQSGRRIISTHKSGCNVGAIFQKYAEYDLIKQIKAIESIKLDRSDPEFWKVSLNKVKRAIGGPMPERRWIHGDPKPYTEQEFHEYFGASAAEQWASAT